MSNDKWAVIRALGTIATYLELSEPNPFKARAFERAARALEKTDVDLEQLVAEKGLLGVEGIGKGIAPVVSELVTTGRSEYLAELQARYPPGIFDLMRVPGLGLKKIGILHESLGIGDLDALEAAARDGRIAKLKGFGAKTAERVLGGIAAARRRHSLLLLAVALEIGESMRERLASIEEVVDAEITGAIRRRLEVVPRVEIVIAARDPLRVMETILSRALIDQVETVDPTTLRGSGRDQVEVVLHFSKTESFASRLLLTTGGDAFLDELKMTIASKGFEIREGRMLFRGREVSEKSEQALFERLGIAFVEPELREDGAELKRKKRTRLVETADLRGTFHIHTTFSDGRNTMLEMLSAARDRGWEYAGISDHSQNAFYARGLTPADLVNQRAEITAHEPAVEPMRVFRGTEADILNDGAIDYGAEILSTFDFVVASVHSRFGMEKDEMTARILRALDDPFVTFLGHLTGRLLLSREGYSIDFDQVFDRAAERGVMIEINGSPRRVELDWRLVRRAVDRGVVLSIHPDAHSIGEYANVITGTWVARKGGLAPRHIFNTRPRDAVSAHLQSRRAAALRSIGRSKRA